MEEVSLTEIDFDGRDLSFETLAEVCGIDIKQLTRVARGQLNVALAQIREATPDLADLELALVIENKAKVYRQVMKDALLTPTALAKHWAALEGMAAQERPAYPVTDPYGCSTCDGLKLIPAPPLMAGYGEAYAPCPDCNAEALEPARAYRARFERIHGHRGESPPPPEPSRLIP